MMIKYSKNYINSVKQHFITFNEQTLVTINDAITKLEQSKIQYTKDTQETYNNFMIAIQNTLNSNIRVLTHKVLGEYDDSYSIRPSIEYWKKCNPAKMMAINSIINNLNENGWKCKITRISSWHIDHDNGGYYGGNDLWIECNFTQ